MEYGMRDTLTLRFLYRTVPGRMALKLLVHPRVSVAAGHFLSSGVSKLLVPWYVKKNHIDMKNVVIPPGGFSSFNDFFTRKIDTGGGFKAKEGHVISPCDGFLTPLKITEGRVFDIKNAEYTLEELLKSRRLSEKFKDGMALVFRLTPANYHRYCYGVSGKALASRRIEGILHCVRPVALQTFPVFVQNSREYQVIRTRDFGAVVQMEIGALMVGKINNYQVSSERNMVRSGEEKGYFEFGGSTVILLLQHGKVRLDYDLLENTENGYETIVRMGERIGEQKLPKRTGKNPVIPE